MAQFPNRAKWPDRDDRPRTWVFMPWPDGRGGTVWHGVKHADVAEDSLNGAYAPELRLTPDEWDALPVTDQDAAEFQAAVDAIAWPQDEREQGGRK